MSTPSSRRSAAARSRRSSAPTPTATTARPRRRWRSGRARRSIGCAPLALESVGPRADAAFDGDYSPDRVLGDGEAIAVDGATLTAVATPGHTSNHLCFAYGRRLVQRRPCDGLVDHRRRPARRRHGRLHGEPGQAAAARRPHLLPGARAAGDQSGAISARPDRPPDAAREADAGHGRRGAERDPRDRRRRLSGARSAAGGRGRRVGARPLAGP